MTLTVKPFNPHYADIPVYVAGAKIGNEITLASNESPFVSRAALKAFRAAVALNAYPAGAAAALAAAIARHHRVTPEQVTTGSGSSVLLQQICQAFAGAGTAVVISALDFSSYRMEALRAGASVIDVPDRGFHTDADGIAAAVERLLQDNPSRPPLVLVGNPANPKGTHISRDAMRSLCRRVAAAAEKTGAAGVPVIVFDSAYGQFVDDAGYSDGVDLLDEFPNIICLFTFSKLFGLAGLRVGYALSAPFIRQVLDHYQPPFLISGPAAAAAMAALEDDVFQNRVRRHVRRWRKKFMRVASRLSGIVVYPSSANFVLLEFSPAAAMTAMDFFNHLKNNGGILVRPIGQTRLRITLGASKSLDVLLQQMEEKLR